MQNKIGDDEDFFGDIYDSEAANTSVVNSGEETDSSVDVVEEEKEMDDSDVTADVTENSTGLDDEGDVDGDEVRCNEESNEDRPTSSHSQQNVDLEMRENDIAESKMVDEFVENGCGCRLYDGKECSSAFTRDHMSLIRDQCLSLTRAELRNVLFGHVMATVRTSADVDNPRHPNKSRCRNTTSYMHEGQKVETCVLECVLY